MVKIKQYHFSIPCFFVNIVNVISHTNVIVPEKLKNFNLQVNETKTEEDEVPDKENTSKKV